MELLDGDVLLREWREDDIPAIAAACQDPDILYWMPLIPRPYLAEHARAFVLDTERPGFAIVQEGRLAGSVDMTVLPFATGHIGYWCAPEARGQGVMTRAVRLFCRHAFERLGRERLELVTDPDNVASQRLAERVGFRREGVLRSHISHPDGRRRDSVMFSLLPGELTAA